METLRLEYIIEQVGLEQKVRLHLREVVLRPPSTASNDDGNTQTDCGIGGKAFDRNLERLLNKVQHKERTADTEQLRDTEDGADCERIDTHNDGDHLHQHVVHSILVPTARRDEQSQVPYETTEPERPLFERMQSRRDHHLKEGAEDTHKHEHCQHEKASRRRTRQRILVAESEYVAARNDHHREAERPP